MANMDILRAKELRGDIIERLYTVYGDDVTVSLLRNMLRYKAYYSEKNIDKAINYLSGAQSEYITLEINVDNYEDSVIKLTSKGVNLAEGDIEDVGVTINES